jgi:metal-dependent hydrolase (beta-lactamase superfamily II)
MVGVRSASLCAGKTIYSVITVLIRCLIAGALIPPGCGCASGEPTTRPMPTFTVVFDNNPYGEGVETAWGFSCLVSGMDKTVLFDTGGERGVLLVLGGFHLTGKSKGEIEAAITGLRKLGVRHVAPCHCTGDAARGLFMQAYREGFIEAGVGKVIDTEGLK